jgi:polyisoprenoid-binding protein YceI
VTTDSSDVPTSRRRKRILIGVGVGVLVVMALAGAFLWWFFRDDAPSAVSIEDAAAQVDDAGTAPDTTPDAGTDPPPETTEPAPDTAAGGPADTAESPADTATTDPAADPAADLDGGDAASGVDGTWTVDTSRGEFSFEDSTGTFVGFRIQEELAAIGSTTAVGRTPEVTGSITVEGTTVTDVSIEADMTAITTNDSRRDDRVQGALETGEFPTATFQTTAPIELGEEALAGEVVSVSATGDLTIHGVTTPVTIPIQAQLVDDTIVVVGSLDVVFADYGVSVPSAPIVLSASDDGQIELQLFLTR